MHYPPSQYSNIGFSNVYLTDGSSSYKYYFNLPRSTANIQLNSITQSANPDFYGTYKSGYFTNFIITFKFLKT